MAAAFNLVVLRGALGPGAAQLRSRVALRFCRARPQHARLDWDRPLYRHVSPGHAGGMALVSGAPIGGPREKCCGVDRSRSVRSRPRFCRLSSSQYWPSRSELSISGAGATLSALRGTLIITICCSAIQKHCGWLKPMCVQSEPGLDRCPLLCDRYSLAAEKCSGVWRVSASAILSHRGAAAHSAVDQSFDDPPSRYRSLPPHMEAGYARRRVGNFAADVDWACHHHPYDFCLSRSYLALPIRFGAVYDAGRVRRISVI